MPRASKSKPKGRVQSIQTSPRSVASAVRSLKKRAETLQAAVKHARRKPSDKAQREVDLSFEVLRDEHADAETILRHAERSGLQTQALKDAIEFAKNALDLLSINSDKNTPPTSKPKSSRVTRSNPNPVMETLDEEEEQNSSEGAPEEGEEEEDATESHPVLMTNPSVRGKGPGKPKRTVDPSTSRERASLVTVDAIPVQNPNPDSRTRCPNSDVRSVGRPVNLSDMRTGGPNPDVRSIGRSVNPSDVRTGGPSPDVRSVDPLAGPSNRRNSDCNGSHRSVYSHWSNAERDLRESELAKRTIQNNIESLKAQLEAQELALERQCRNVEINQERVSNEGDRHSQSLGESSESVHGQKERNISPPRSSRVDDWVDQAEKQTKEQAEKRAEKQSKTAKNDTTSMLGELSTATAAVLRQQLLQSQNATGLSFLEGIKILERRRPSEKFTGEDSKIDFEDHLAQFKKAIAIPGLPASFKLAELKEWFGGVAKIQIARYLKREDDENALEEAIEKLRSEHGCKATNAEEMIEDILSGKPLEARDAVAINTAVSKLEEAYFLAVETGRDADFNRNSLFKNILSSLFPYLTIKWAAEVAKAQNKGKRLDTFEDFLCFLQVQKRVATVMRKLTSDPEKSEKSTKTNKKSVQKEDKDEDGFKKVENKKQKSKSTDRPKPEPRECSLCENEKHWLHDCKKFADMDIEARWEYVFERSICPKCMRWTHKVEDCTYVARCGSCGGGHNTRLHGAKHMSEDLKRPIEADKKA